MKSTLKKKGNLVVKSPPDTKRPSQEEMGVYMIY